MRFNGADRTTSLVSSTELTATIPASDLTTAGTFTITVFNPAPGGGISNAQTFTVNHPVPVTNSILPSSKTVGDAGFIMTVTGANFVSGSIVRFDGVARATNLIRSTELTATIPASDLTTAGTFNIIVFNPAPGGGASNAQTFIVNNPAPTTSSISPSNKIVGEAGFSMTVKGTNFIPASVVRFNGADRATNLVSSTELTATISASDLTTAATFNITVFNPGPGGGNSNAQTFTVNNPAPTSTSISPSSKTVGDAGFTMTVDGTNFVAGSVVRFNGSDRTTTFVSSTRLTATVAASDLTTVGTFSVTVFNPAPGGGTSNAQTFTVNAANNPAPTITSTSPTSKTVGDAQFTMTVNGTNFVAGSVVKFDGSNRATTFVNSTQLNITIPESDLMTAGTFNITVFNPPPGGGTSNAQTFTVNNPIPTTTNLSPSNKTVGEAGFTLTVQGTNFVPGSVVKLGGSNRPTSFVNSMALTAAIPASDLTTAGAFNITVFNPLPGGGTSNAQTLTVSPVGNPLPTLASVSPTSKTVGAAQFTMIVNGTNFVSSSMVKFNGSDRPTTFVNGTELTATIPASDLTTPGTFNITVFNPPPGGGTSNAKTFTVSTADNPVPTLTSIMPTSKTVGDAGFIMTVKGTNYIPASVVSFGGSNRPTAFLSSMELIATIPPSDLTTAGTFNITVFNPLPGGGTSNAQTFTVSPVDNPVPTLVSISPTSKTVGDGQFMMTVTGANFVSGCTVRFNGSDRPTTFINSTQLTAMIPAGDLTAAGTFNISVFNSAPGGGTSTAQTFTVNNPVPATTSISPANKTVGDADFAMIVNGQNFVSESVVRFNGSNRPTTFVNNTELTATILASDLITAGTFNITVFNLAPGGGTSNAQAFIVRPQNVTLRNVSPTSGNRLETLNVVFTGTNFIGGVTSVNVGKYITVNSRTVDSPTSLKANLTITAFAVTGQRAFSVTNIVAPDSVTSEPMLFTVNNPAPILEKIDPAFGGRRQSLEVVFKGKEFFNDASSVNVGQGITVESTTVDDQTTLRAVLTIAGDATPGGRNFFVTNSGPGGGRSDNLTFTVKQNRAPSITHTPSSPHPSGQEIPVQALIVDDDSVGIRATLYYRQGGEANFNAIGMTSSSSTFQKNIPADAVTSRGVEYFITAEDADSLTSRLPVSGIFSIQIQVDKEAKPDPQPHGSTQNAYRLISMPLDLNDKSPGAVLQDDLGEYDDTRWRFSEFLANQTYAEFPNTSPMTPGKAFWLIAVEAGKVIGTGAGKSNRTDAKYAVALHHQWNFIGNPFNFAIPVGNLRLKSGGQSPPNLYFYNGTWNDPFITPVRDMRPFEGYAVYSNALSGDTLFIDPDLSLRETLTPESNETLWSIRILAESRQARDVNNVATVVASASRARDRMDHPEPPGVGEYVSVYFPHRDWVPTSPGYCTDARPEFSQGEIWSFEVASNIRDQVNLTFAGVAEVPEGFEVWVMDEALQLSQNLRESNRYAVAGSGPEHPKKLKLIVGRAEFVAASLTQVKVIPASYEMSQNFPNPFNPATTIRYGLPKAERVTLKVYNPLGEEVVTLIDNASKEAGYHAAIWDGRNQSRQQVASGIYFYRLLAGSFVMVKKMVLVQ
ncbi:MAG: IPT/TIG domain-containing protein [bacterium]